MIVEPAGISYRNTDETAVKRQTTSFAIFTLPKPFDNPHVNLIQRNAICSWKQLGANVEVILLGNEGGIAETAAEFGLKHSAEIGLNEYGTPLLSDAFRRAHEISDADVLIYCNCDIILLRDLVETIELIQHAKAFESFVAFGRRIDLLVENQIDFAEPHEVKALIELANTSGRKAPIVCKDYFAFSRELYQEIPKFAVGRGNWDNWMLAHAKSKRVPAIDVSEMVQIIHQDHQYLHMQSSRLNCYVSGPEAKENRRLAGGANIIGGSTGTWKFGTNGLRPIRASWLNPSFWMDLHRFAKFAVRLPFER